jgi:hypothetical protein
VCFAARELWGAQAAERDCVYVDMWDDYLEAALVPCQDLTSLTQYRNSRAMRGDRLRGALGGAGVRAGRKALRAGSFHLERMGHNFGRRAQVRFRSRGT